MVVLQAAATSDTPGDDTVVDNSEVIQPRKRQRAARRLVDTVPGAAEPEEVAPSSPAVPSMPPAVVPAVAQEEPVAPSPLADASAPGYVSDSASLSSSSDDSSSPRLSDRHASTSSWHAARHQLFNRMVVGSEVRTLCLRDLAMAAMHGVAPWVRSEGHDVLVKRCGRQFRLMCKESCEACGRVAATATLQSNPVSLSVKRDRKGEMSLAELLSLPFALYLSLPLASPGCVT
jgi:hypothetical protein